MDLPPLRVLCFFVRSIGLPREPLDGILVKTPCGNALFGFCPWFCGINLRVLMDFHNVTPIFPPVQAPTERVSRTNEKSVSPQIFPPAKYNEHLVNSTVLLFFLSDQLSFVLSIVGGPP